MSYLLMQLKAIHLALVTSHRKLEGSYESLRQERVRYAPTVCTLCLPAQTHSPDMHRNAAVTYHCSWRWQRSLVFQVASPPA